jgi:WD40 repeat protein
MTLPLIRRLVLSPTLFWSSVGFAALPAGDPIDFRRDVYPILKANCIACHNKTTTKADLNMETPELMKKGGESGPGLLAGKGAESIILQAAAHEWDSEMPPKSNKVGAVNLTADELALLKRWIDQGAKSSDKQFVQIPWQPLPAGLNPIYSVAMTQDGQLAACSRANQIFIYDLATLQMETRLTDADLIKQEIYKNAGVAHRDLVQSLAFSPDGQRLASGSYREVKMWRRELSAPVLRKGDATMGALVSVISEDGSMIASAGKDGALHLLDAATGKPSRTLPGVVAQGTRLLALSPDASMIAVWSGDSTLSLWSVRDGKRLASKSGVNGTRDLVWAKDGKSLCSAGEDKTVLVWPLPPAADVEWVAKEIKGATGAITALKAGAGPDHLLSAGEDNIVRLWSISSGKIEREYKIPGALSISMSPDAKLLAAGCADGVVRVMDAQTAKPVIELRGDVAGVKRLAELDWRISAEALEAAFQTSESARLDAEIKALDERAKKAVEAVTAGKKSLPEKQKAVQPAQVAKSAAQKAADEVAALMAKAPGGKPDAALEKQNKEAQDKLMAALKSEETAVASVKTADDQIKDAEAEIVIIGDAKSKNTQALANAKKALEASKQASAKATAELATAKAGTGQVNGRPLCIDFSEDGTQLAAAGADGSLRIWAVRTGRPISLSPGIPTNLASMSALGDGQFVSCGADGTVSRASIASRWILDRVLGGDKVESPLVDRVNAISFSADGRMLAVGGGEPSRTGDISVWEVSSGKLLHDWKERHSDSVLSLDFSPDGKYIASGGGDKAVRITEIASGKQVRVFEGHTHHVLGIAFRADGRILASAGADNVVKIWDMITGDRKKNIDGWDKEVTSVQFIGATDQIVTSAGDNRIRMVRDSGAEVRAMAGLPDFMHGAAATASGSAIIGGGQDSVLRVWEGTTGKEVAVFGASVK